MSKIKVGDWVRWDRGKVSEVLAVSEECLIKNHSALSNGCNIHNHDLELWKPQVGDWCWFYTRDTPILSKFYVMEHGRYTESILWTNQDKCEPFIGNLPSFIKE